MTATPRRIDNNLRDSYNAAVFEIGGADFQGFIPCDETGAPYSLSNPIPTGIVENTVSSPHTDTVVSVTTTSTQILAAYAGRNPRSWARNISDTDLYVSFSSPASNAKPTKIAPDGVFLIGPYTGALYAIHYGSGSKSLEVMEL